MNFKGVRRKFVETIFNETSQASNFFKVSSKSSYKGVSVLLKWLKDCLNVSDEKIARNLQDDFLPQG